MTFKEIQDEVLAAGFAETYRTRVKQWVNDAQARIAANIDLRSFQATATANTVAGTATVNLAADFRRLRYVFIDPGATSDNIPLTPLEGPEDYDSLPTISGQPESFTVKGTQLVLWPTPNAVVSLSIAYFRNPATLTADGDVPELANPPYHDALVEYATWHAFRREGDPERAKVWQDQFESSLLDLGVALQHDTFARPAPQVRGAWG